MSVIVAIKKDGIVYLGADSQATKGGSRLSLSNQNNYKIWKVKGVDNCLMGCVGNHRDGCAIRTIDCLIEENVVKNDGIDFDYIVKHIEPMIKNELIEHDFIDENSPYQSMESRYVFAYKDRLYTIEYGAVIEHDDFVAIGSGECEAIGSLLTSSKNMEPNTKIIKAIKATATHDIYVDYPIVLANTKNSGFKVITEK